MTLELREQKIHSKSLTESLTECVFSALEKQSILDVTGWQVEQ